MGPFGNEALGIAALVSFVLTTVLFALDLIPIKSSRRSRHSRTPSFGKIAMGSGITATVVFVFLTFVNFVVFFWFQPALVGIYGGWFWITLDVFIALVGFGLLAIIQKRLSASVVVGGLCLVIWLVVGGMQAIFTPASDAGAKELANLVRVEVADPGVYPETDADHIVLVPEETARFKARNIIAEAKDEHNRNLSTVYKPVCGVLQSINQHLYWICSLQYSGFRVSNQVNRIVPGYIVVDAEDPNAKAEVRLGYPMKYTFGSPLNTSLERLIYNSGYRHWIVDDLTLEVRDDWKPFYTASLNKRALRFKGSVPELMIIIDPETGEITEYPLDKVPEWVDRVYSAHVVKNFLTWWGRWSKAPWKFAFETSADRTKPAGEPVLVYTKGGHPSWQVLMKSRKKGDDTSVTGIILFDARSNTAKLYDVSGIAIESDVVKAFTTSSKNIKSLHPVHPSLHRIYGELTWVASYISPDTNQDNAEPFQAVGLVSAFNIDGANIIMEEFKQDALAAYRKHLARGSANRAPEEGRIDKIVKGVVVDVATAVVRGETNYFIRLDSDPYHIFQGVIGESIELPFVKVGSSVIITYLDVGKIRVDITSYDDVLMDLGVGEVPKER